MTACSAREYTAWLPQNKTGHLSLQTRQLSPKTGQRKYCVRTKRAHFGEWALVLVRRLPLSPARHLHPFFPKLQPCLLVDPTRRPRSFIQTRLRLMQVSHKISVDHRVQCGGERKVPNEKPQAPVQNGSCGPRCDVPHDRHSTPCRLAQRNTKAGEYLSRRWLAVRAGGAAPAYPLDPCSRGRLSALVVSE
ncbi:hypothetical protein ABIC08_007698 [Bradyrhizobium sp. RT9b]